MNEAMPKEAPIGGYLSITDQPALGEHLLGPGTVGAMNEQERVSRLLSLNKLGDRHAKSTQPPGGGRVSPCRHDQEQLQSR